MSEKGKSARPDYGTFQQVVLPQLLSAAYKIALIGVLSAVAINPVLNYIAETFRARSWSEAAIFSLLLNGCHTLCYVLCNGFFFSIDMFGWIKLDTMPRKSFMKSSTSLIRRTFIEATISQTVVGPLLGYYVFYPITQYFNVPPLGSALPSPLKMSALLMFAYLFNEFGFYFTHRALHTKLLYARFHKQHHTYTGTMSISAEFASPVEVATSNQFPTLGGLIFLGAHPVLMVVWLSQRLLNTYEAHSGYDLSTTWLGKVGLANSHGAAFHDYHHTVNRGNFGSPLTDWFGGTMDGWITMGGQDGYRSLHAKWNSDSKAKVEDVISGGL
jgi:methylsterol monooxygenase